MIYHLTAIFIVGSPGFRVFILFLVSSCDLSTFVGSVINNKLSFKRDVSLEIKYGVILQRITLFRRRKSESLLQYIKSQQTKLALP